MLPTTITLSSTLSTPSAETFEFPKRTATGQTYVSESPQGDIQGAPGLRIETSKTSKGIERGVIQLQRPIWDAAKGQYVWFTTVHIQANRHVSLPTELIQSDIEKVCSMPPEVIEAFAKAQL